jgi:hypothetical protein
MQINNNDLYNVGQWELDNYYSFFKDTLAAREDYYVRDEEDLRKELHYFRNAIIHEKFKEVSRAIVLRYEMPKLNAEMTRLIKSFIEIENDTSDQHAIVKTIIIGRKLLALENEFKLKAQELDNLYVTLSKFELPDSIQDYKKMHG